MQTATKQKFVHLKATLSRVNLCIQEDGSTRPGTLRTSGASCEVIEFDDDEGWDLWTESGFLPDFGDSVFSLPTPLHLAGVSARLGQYEMSDPFGSVTKNSA